MKHPARQCEHPHQSGRRYQHTTLNPFSPSQWDSGRDEKSWDYLSLHALYVRSLASEDLAYTSFLFLLAHLC